MADLDLTRHPRTVALNSIQVKRFVEARETMPDLTPEELPQAQKIAYQKSLARGNGQDPPPYHPEASVGDFWQAAWGGDCSTW